VFAQACIPGVISNSFKLSAEWRVLARQYASVIKRQLKTALLTACLTLTIRSGLYLECSGWGVTGEQGVPFPSPPLPSFPLPSFPLPSLPLLSFPVPYPPLEVGPLKSS